MLEATDFVLENSVKTYKGEITEKEMLPIIGVSWNGTLEHSTGTVVISALTCSSGKSFF